MTAFVLSGVSGVGKSTIGALACDQLAIPFIEADDFHPEANIAKMSAGIPLSDADRAPWIDRLAADVNARGPIDLVIACSALTRFVRSRLRTHIVQPVRFVYLSAEPEVIQQRLNQRGQHFMKAGMLASQLETLEPPRHAIVVDARRPRNEVVHEVIRLIQKERLAS